MPDFKRPGAYLSETLANPPVSSTGIIGQAVILGTHARGPLGVTQVTSFQAFVNLYGGFVPGQVADDLLLAVYLFFNNGGRVLRVVRVPDGNEVASSVSINDTEPTASGPPATPRPTLAFSAANPGSWGNNISLLTALNPTDPTRFSITVYYGGVAPKNVMEKFSDLTMDVTDQRYVEHVVNSGVLGSNYIVVTDQHLMSAHAVSLAHATPAVTGSPVPLTGGVDSSGAPTTDDWTAALSLLDNVGDPITLNLAGITTAPLVNAALAYANNRGDVFVAIDGATDGADVSTALTLTQSYAASDLSYGAVWFPRPIINDPSSTAVGALRVVAPGGAILGQFAANDAARGVQKTPAGLSARIQGAVGLEVTLSNDDLDLLNTSQVNAIRSLPGAGVVLFGGRTLTTSGRADKYISVRRTLIYVKAQLVQLTQFALFEPNYYLLWQQVDAIVNQFLTGFWQQGGLSGASASEAFYVVCDDTNNTNPTVANGEMHLDVGIAPQEPAEFIAISISQYNGTVSVAEAA